MLRPTPVGLVFTAAGLSRGAQTLKVMRSRVATRFSESRLFYAWWLIVVLTAQNSTSRMIVDIQSIIDILMMTHQELRSPWQDTDDPALGLVQEGLANNKLSLAASLPEPVPKAKAGSLIGVDHPDGLAKEIRFVLPGYPSPDQFIWSSTP